MMNPPLTVYMLLPIISPLTFFRSLSSSPVTATISSKQEKKKEKKTKQKTNKMLTSNLLSCVDARGNAANFDIGVR